MTWIQKIGIFTPGLLESTTGSYLRVYWTGIAPLSMLSTNQTWLVQIVATKSKTFHCTLFQYIYSRLYNTTPTYIKQTEKDLN